MTTGVLGLFASFLIAVAIVGAMSWSLNDKSDHMVVDSEAFNTIIELQRTDDLSGRFR